jgi:hypothetical protein
LPAPAVIGGGARRAAHRTGGADTDKHVARRSAGRARSPRQPPHARRPAAPHRFSRPGVYRALERRRRGGVSAGDISAAASARFSPRRPAARRSC